MPRAAVRTFLFSDLRDYSSFVETRGDAEATKLLRSYRRIVRAEIATHRGAEIKTEGDSFYVVFRRPGDAIRAAVGIQQRARRATERRPDLPLRVGIGINTGEAVEHEGGYVGSAVIVASRLKDVADAGTILITDTVRALVRTGGLAPLRDRGTWRLKGIAHAIRVFEVELGATATTRALGPALPLPAILVQAPSPAGGLVICPELVQREEPLAALLGHLAATATGESRIVSLRGEAGVGKTRLCRELARLAHGDGFYVFGGRSHAGRAVPYEPFVAALRPYAHARGADILRRLLGPLVPELRRLLPEMDLPTQAEGARVPGDERRERFLRAIHLLLEDAAAQRPVLLVVEDFHDADAASRELLLYLASSVRTGICVVFTFRDDEVGPRHPLAALVSRLERDRRLSTVRLAPLDAAGVARMTTALAGARATPELARAVYERSEGVPFYVEELLKTALDDTQATAERLPLPRSVSDSVQLRVARLAEARGAAAGEFLEAVAVAGVPLGYDTLLRLSAREEQEAAADLAAALEAQLLERPATQAELYQFRHALTREAIASAIPPERRRRLHARVAEALVAPGAAGPNAALLARHFAAAGDRASAVRYARTGAASAARLGAYATAIELLSEASAHAAGGVEEVVVLEELGVVLLAAGRATEAEAALARARGLVGADRPVETARLDVRLAAALRMQGRRTEAVATVRRAVPALEGAKGEGLAEALVLLAELAWAENDAAEAAALARRALDIAGAPRAGRVVTLALTVLGTAESRLGEPAAVDTLREAVRAGLADGLGAESANAYFELSRALLLRGKTDEAGMTAEEGLELARRHGLELVQARLLAHLTTIRVNQGRYREARAVAEQAVALARPDTIAADAARIALAHVLTNQGEHDAALAIFEQIAPRMARWDPDRRITFLSYRAQAYLGAQRLDAAAAAAAAAVEATVAIPGMGMTAFLNAAGVAEARRDVAGIHAISDEFERYFAGRDTAILRMVRREIAAIRDALEGRDAAASFESLAAGWEAVGGTVHALYRRASGAIARLGDGQLRRGALRELRALREALAERGALRYVAVIDTAIAERAPARPRAEGPLRPRELRAAVLIARGFTDQRIAYELGLSVPEASGVVRSVQAKLGVASRSQVAAWVVGRQDAAEPVTASPR